MDYWNKVSVILFKMESNVMNGKQLMAFASSTSQSRASTEPINVEIIMGHHIGVSAPYYKPAEREVMEDYLKAVDSLTINGEKLYRKSNLQNKKKKLTIMNI